MKVEMVMTPEGCRRQTSKNSRDSSAVIANLPTPLFPLHLFYFFFIRETRVLFHLLLRSISILLPRGEGLGGCFIYSLIFVLTEVLLCSCAPQLLLYRPIVGLK